MFLMDLMEYKYVDEQVIKRKDPGKHCVILRQHNDVSLKWPKNVIIL